MKRRLLLQIGAASLVAAAAALAGAPSARAACVDAVSPPNGTYLACPSVGNFSVLVFNRPGNHVRDNILTTTGTANLRMECTSDGLRRRLSDTYVAFSGVAEGVQDPPCSKLRPQISYVRCGDTVDCR